MKSCWICAWCVFHPGERDWSDIAPGNCHLFVACDPTIFCDKGHKELCEVNFFSDSAKTRAIDIAIECPDFMEATKANIKVARDWVLAERNKEGDRLFDH